MAVPTIKTAPAIYRSTTTALTHPVALPVTQTNDTLLLAIATSSSQTPTAPDGTWYLVGAQGGVSSTNSRVTVYLKLNCAASGATTATFSLTSQSRNMVSACVALSPLKANMSLIQVGSANLGGQATLVVPQLTAIAESLWIYAFAGTGGGTYTPDPDWTEQADDDSTGTTNQPHLLFATRPWNTSGPTDSAETFTRTPAGGAGSYAHLTALLLDSSVNQNPVVTIANPMKVVVLGDSVSFTATPTDPDGSIVSVQWAEVLTNSTFSPVTLTGATTNTITFTPTRLGGHTFTCTATDDGGATAFATAGCVVMEPGILVKDTTGMVRARVTV